MNEFFNKYVLTKNIILRNINHHSIINRFLKSLNNSILIIFIVFTWNRCDDVIFERGKKSISKALLFIIWWLFRYMYKSLYFAVSLIKENLIPLNYIHGDHGCVQISIIKILDWWAENSYLLNFFSLCIICRNFYA